MKWNLIYIDDQIENIECYSELLNEKFNVIGCTNGASAIKALEQFYPHGILLDVHMPGNDGYELYKQIVEHPLYNDCPILFISGDQSNETKIRSFREGAVDFLTRDTRADEVIIRLVNKVNLFLKLATKLELGNLSVNCETMQASIGTKNIDLTLLELRLLSTIIRLYPQSVSRMELIEKVWGNTTVKPGTVNTHLTNLKPKLEGWNYQVRMREENIVVLPN